VSSERRIEKLGSGHPVGDFDCGQPHLNNWFQRHAMTNQGANATQTYIGLVGDTVVGYYSLAVGQVEHAEAAERLSKGLAKHPIPVMLLARLAVHKDWQKQGVGRGLMRDAFLRTIEAAKVAGIRALVVHAKDDDARRYYEQFDFASSPTDPLHLWVLVKDLTKLTSR
jgi:GNAT superfamily N-acetyltransferase